MSPGGLVGTTHFLVLPQVPPLASLSLLMLGLLPALYHVACAPRAQGRAKVVAQAPALALALTRAVSHACLTGFLLGYHVHEKAVLTVRWL